VWTVPRLPACPPARLPPAWAASSAKLLAANPCTLSLPYPVFAPCSFLVESFEEEFATVVGVNWVMWCIVLVSFC
jgi:hypothetical protein